VRWLRSAESRGLLWHMQKGEDGRKGDEEGRGDEEKKGLVYESI
jgi:hypothetical protein